MSRVKALLSKVETKNRSLNESGSEASVNPSVINGNNRQRLLTQYTKSGNTVKPVGPIQLGEKMDPGVYNVRSTFDSGIYFEKADIRSDEILRFKDERQDLVINEIANFWTLKQDFDEMGFVHKRGMVLYGPPGSGKTCILKLVMENMVKGGNLVFIVKGTGALVEGLKNVREIEPDRKIVVILEDVDKLVQYDEHSILELFDGETQVDNVLFLATTNYIQRLPERMLRSGRFDQKVEVPFPPLEGRKAYLEMKLKKKLKTDEIEKMAEDTDGLSFGDLRELLVSVYCLKYNFDETLKRLKAANGMGAQPYGKSTYTRSWDEAKVDQRLEEAFAKEAADLQSLNEANAKKSKARKVIEDLEIFLPQSIEATKIALQARLDRLGISDVTVDSVDCDAYGNMYVDFADLEGNLLSVAFSVDDNDGASALVMGDNDEPSLVVDLDSLAPSQKDTPYGKYLNLQELEWLNKTTLLTILNAGDFSTSAGEPTATKQDAYGNILGQRAESKNESKSVIRGGKKSKLPIIYERQYSALSYKQRMALSKPKREAKGKHLRSLKAKVK